MRETIAAADNGATAPAGAGEGDKLRAVLSELRSAQARCAEQISAVTARQEAASAQAATRP